MDPQANNQRVVSEFSLWIGVLLPPIAWAVQMQTNYTLASFECHGGSRTPVFLIAAVALLVTLATGTVAVFNFQRVRALWNDNESGIGSRQAFLAALGVLTSGMFSLVIIAQGVATMMIHPCLR